MSLFWFHFSNICFDYYLITTKNMKSLGVNYDFLLVRAGRTNQTNLKYYLGNHIPCHQYPCPRQPARFGNSPVIRGLFVNNGYKFPLRILDTIL